MRQLKKGEESIDQMEEILPQVVGSDDVRDIMAVYHIHSESARASSYMQRRIQSTFWPERKDPENRKNLKRFIGYIRRLRKLMYQAAQDLVNTSGAPV